MANLAFAQQIPMYSQYMNNKLLINPGAAGSEDYIPVRLTARQQWVGISGAPSTQAFSGNFLLGNKNMGLGGYVFSDRFGIDSKVGVQLAYSYILDLGLWDSKLALGISATGFQYSFNTSDAILTNEDDPTVSYSQESTFVPDAGFGVYWHNKKFFFGASANQLIEYKVDYKGLKGREIDASENTLQRHYFVMGGYKFKLAKDFNIEPSTMLKFTEGSAPLNMDVNLKTFYKKHYWIGVSYRTGIPFETGNSIIAMIGATYKHIVIGYAFDYMFSNINTYSRGTHEIMIGYNFGEKIKKGSSLL